MHVPDGGLDVLVAGHLLDGSNRRPTHRKVRADLDMLILRLVSIPEPFRRHAVERLSDALDDVEEFLAKHEQADEQARELN